MVELLPMSDGGDGFGEVISTLIKGRPRTISTLNAAHQACKSKWWLEPRSGTAIIEAAAVIGLAMLPATRFHPFKLDTLGLGRVLKAAALGGARRCLIGIGGSATNDGGFGMARALGWTFLDRRGHPIECWTGLKDLNSVRAPEEALRFEECRVAVDVQNPLVGPRGSTRIYGPQKGLRPEDFPLAETCLRRLATVVEKAWGNPEGLSGKDRDGTLPKIASLPGSGAAGGLGFGLRVFLGARLEAGFEVFARYADLEQRLRSADVVVTGEGAIDRSTIMGKGVGELARRCREIGVPCIGLAGTLGAPAPHKYFSGLASLTAITTTQQAKSRAGFWLERLAEKTARQWVLSPGGGLRSPA
jgi:glycerate 2-kinase